jgi:hypothetical protein
MVFNAIFNVRYFSYIVAVSYIERGNRSTQKKTTDMLQVTDKLYHMRLYRVHYDMSRMQTHRVSGDRH